MRCKRRERKLEHSTVNAGLDEMHGGAGRIHSDDPHGSTFGCRKKKESTFDRRDALEDDDWRSRRRWRLAEKVNDIEGVGERLGGYKAGSDSRWG